ncbi:MAG: hypothetical protein WCI51_16725 [Lentisphaerota bacterium]
MRAESAELKTGAIKNSCNSLNLLSTRSANWIHDAKWGVFMHFISDAPGMWMPQGGIVPGKWTCDSQMTPAKWNEIVDGFDVKALASQLEELAAGYYCLTIGQNSGYYCSPSAAYDRITGVKSPDLSKCSRRDLVAELYTELSQRGIRLMVYLPAAPPARDPNAILSFEYTLKTEKFYTSWTDEDYIRRYEEMSAVADSRLIPFQRKWEAVIAEWSLRWGKKVSGWWIDGCYEEPMARIHRHPEPPNFQSFADAMRTGNPESIICLNPGVVYPVRRVDEVEDYLAGEVGNGEDIRRAECIGRFESGAQFHILAPLGVSWAQGPVVRPVDRIFEETAAVTDFGGAVTWDMPFKPDGNIPDDIFTLLKDFSKLINATRGKPDKPEVRIPRARLKILSYPSISLDGKLIDGAAELQMSNTREVTVEGGITLATTEDSVLVEPAYISYRLAPGKEQQVSLLLKLARNGSEVTLKIVNGVLSHSVKLPFRNKFELFSSDDSIKLKDIKVKLATAPELQFKAPDGKIYGYCRIGVCRDKLAFWALVEDCDIKLNPLYSQGSCIELFFAKNDVSPVRQLFLVPESKNSKAALYRLDSNFFEVDGSESQSVSYRSYYEISCLIPSSMIFGGGFSPEHFLFEASASVSEKGGQTKATLFGSSEAYRSSAYYAELLNIKNQIKDVLCKKN